MDIRLKRKGFVQSICLSEECKTDYSKKVISDSEILFQRKKTLQI